MADRDILNANHTRIGWVVVEQLDDYAGLRVRLLPHAGCREHYSFDLREPVAQELLYALAAGLRDFPTT